jgi:hypothetical protein
MSAIRPRDVCQRNSCDLPQSPVLYRFEVPQSEASEVLRLLAYYNIDAARLFPGLRAAW